MSANQTAKDVLAFDQCSIAKVFTVQPQNVERVEIRFGAAKQQVIKLRTTAVVETNNLAIHDGAFTVESLGDRCTQRVEPFVRVIISGNQSAGSALDVCQRS